MIYVTYEREAKISASKVRTMCINNSLYTKGTNEEYFNMFKMCKEYSGNDEELSKIAWDIIDHSDSDELEDFGFETIYEIVAWIMGMILNDCTYISFKVKEEEK